MPKNNVTLKITEPTGAKYEMNYEREHDADGAILPAIRPHGDGWSAGGWAFGIGLGLGLAWWANGTYHPYPVLPYPPYPYNPYRYPYPYTAPVAGVAPVVSEASWRKGTWMFGTHDNVQGWWFIVDDVYYPYASPPAPPEPASNALDRIQETKEMLSETDPQAAKLGYREDAFTVDKVKFTKYAPPQACSNCARYKGAPGSPKGKCSVFKGNQVSSKGWCSAYMDW